MVTLRLNLQVKDRLGRVGRPGSSSAIWLEALFEVAVRLQGVDEFIGSFGSHLFATLSWSTGPFSVVLSPFSLEAGISQGCGCGSVEGVCAVWRGQSDWPECLGMGTLQGEG